MKRLSIVVGLLALTICGQQSLGAQFDPKKDGWHIENWGEPKDNNRFTWELFRKSYLGVNPTHDWFIAPLDCTFYEIFKICADDGHCCGMSVLGLALFKYGGYMGFCAPAYVYAEDPVANEGPKRDDLHDVFNILQARQFSVSGLTAFVDAFDEGIMLNGKEAFDRVKESLAKRDYPALIIAKDPYGGDAHVVIPYKMEDPGPGKYPKYMYVWDSNHPYDDDPKRYDEDVNNAVVIADKNGDWVYTPETGDDYEGWIICLPMSYVLRKARHPGNVKALADAIRTFFTSSPGADVVQISDDDGHQFYETDGGPIQTDPDRRLKGCVRWPWFGEASARRAGAAAVASSKVNSDEDRALPELYFIRGPIDRTSALNFTITGEKYEATLLVAGNLIKIECESSVRGKDVIRFSGLATGAQSVQISTLAPRRDLAVKQLRTGATQGEWRSFDIQNLSVTRDAPVMINMAGDLDAISVSSRDKDVNFDLNIQQRTEGNVVTRNMGRLATSPGELIRVAPRDWSRLDNTELLKGVQTLKPMSPTKGAPQERLLKGPQ